MPFTLPTAASTGDVLTATNYNQAVRSNAMFGMATFTNEAARDAALTSPEEGMMAYLTAPTVPAATGTTTAVPTGVTTIYNGSVWVCTTPVGAFSNTQATTTSTSYVNTLTSDSTAISVTLVTGTTVLLSMTTQTAHSTTGQVNWLSFAVSGATTVAAADAQSILANEAVGTYQFSLARTFIYTGLTAGTNTFTLNYKTQGATATFFNRNLTVQGVA